MNNSVQAVVTNADGHPVSGQVVRFTSTNGAKVTPEIGTTGADGIVSAILTSTLAGSSTLTATANGSSQTVNVTFIEVPVLKDISVNDHSFALSDGFPTTGFTGARFKLTLSSDSADYYDWSSGGSSWVSVDDEGNVTFTGKGNSTPVTITATPKEGGTQLTYTFTITSWFTNNGNNKTDQDNAERWCINQGLRQPDQEELSRGKGNRAVGTLWSEWGSMSGYSGSTFNNDRYWAYGFISYPVAVYDKNVNLRDGEMSGYIGNDLYTVCLQSL